MSDDNPELYTWPTTINGRWTLRLPAYRAIRYLHEGMWERERLASMWLNLANTDRLLDVGAESGDMSALFASWLSDGGVFLVEPNPRAWPGIRTIWEANALPDPLGWYVGFAAAEERSVPADFEASRKVGSWPACACGPIDPACGFAHLAEQADSISATTIDALAARMGKVDAITMDVEGAEFEALKGARDTLETERPLVWVSVHRAFMRHHFGQTPAQLRAFMRDLDYDADHLGDDHESHWMFSPR